MPDIGTNLINSLNIADLKLDKLIGKGGQKEVYLACYRNRIIVFKAIFTDENSFERVKREIRAGKVIEHSNIPQIIKSNIDEIKNPDELIWVIEEYVDGLSLRRSIIDKRKFDISEIIDFLDTMLNILIKAEEKKIVHRDIKPENIIIDKNNKFWLIDFGISRHLDLESITSTNSPFGAFTLGYAASEQLRNHKKDIDIRADLFSLGVVAAEMIIGYNPHTNNTNDIIQIIKNIEQQPLPLLRIQGDSQYLLAKFIKMLGDNRISRRPRNVEDAKILFDIVKSTIKVK